MDLQEVQQTDFILNLTHVVTNFKTSVQRFCFIDINHIFPTGKYKVKGTCNPCWRIDLFINYFKQNGKIHNFLLFIFYKYRPIWVPFLQMKPHTHTHTRAWLSTLKVHPPSSCIFIVSIHVLMIFTGENVLI